MSRTLLVVCVLCFCVSQAAIASNQTEENSLPTLSDIISGNDKQILKGGELLRSAGEPYDCRCGERNDPPRIVGGKATKANEFPWMARMTFLNKFYCAGSLINDLYVLTAGHCIETVVFSSVQWSLINIRLGEHEICEANHQYIDRRVVHARTLNFNLKTFEDDIALLKMNERVPLTDAIRPICLPSPTDDEFVGRMATITGWGSVNENEPTACELQEVEVPIISNQVCRSETDYPAKVIGDRMMCAGFLDVGKKDACQSDSGGPLTLERADKRLEIVGIVSWGRGCGRPRYPGVYTRLTKYLDWIKEHSSDGRACAE